MPLATIVPPVFAVPSPQLIDATKSLARGVGLTWFATGDGFDAEPVTLEVVDSKGRVVPTAGPEVTFSNSGPGTVIGLNNGDPTNHEAEKGMQHSTFHGLAQVIVQTNLNGRGSYTLQATSPSHQACGDHA